MFMLNNKKNKSVSLLYNSMLLFHLFKNYLFATKHVCVFVNDLFSLLSLCICTFQLFFGFGLIRVSWQRMTFYLNVSRWHHWMRLIVIFNMNEHPDEWKYFFSFDNNKQKLVFKKNNNHTNTSTSCAVYSFKISMFVLF